MKRPKLIQFIKENDYEDDYYYATWHNYLWNADTTMTTVTVYIFFTKSTHTRMVVKYTTLIRIPKQAIFKKCLDYDRIKKCLEYKTANYYNSRSYDIEVDKTTSDLDYLKKYTNSTRMLKLLLKHGETKL